MNPARSENTTKVLYKKKANTWRKYAASAIISLNTNINN